ncbi:MAG: hypothetical protein QW275_00475, partial [Candidatus Anstonellaceae archaeon]
LSEKQVSLSGSGRLASCNPDPFCAYLSRMGAKAECTSHSLPMRVEGPLKESKLVYFAELGTQFLSGILLCSPFSSEGVEIVIEGELAKWEHVEATLGIMKACGIEIGTIGQDFIWVEPEQAYLPCQLEVPPSSYLSSFPLLAGALCGKVEAKGNLALEKFFSLLQSFGAFAHHSSSSFSASAGALSSSQFYVSDLAEFLPHAIVLASVCQKPSAFHGIAALKPRMKARLGILLSELSKMGVRYENKGNTLEVLGCKLSGANLDPQGDTISALALCTAALCASGPSKMQGADCITRVYPAFFKDMLQLGAIIRHI